MKITRTVVRQETIEVPKGYRVCNHCKGHGRLTAYDRGVRSAMYSPSLDAPEVCYACGGPGYVPDE